MTKDTFVNLNLFYEEIIDPLNDLETKVIWAKGWLNDECFNNCWISKDAKIKINYSIQESEKALGLISEIQKILLEFNKKGSRKSARVPQQNPRISHMKVIRGGLYKPPEVTITGILSGAGRAWTKKYRKEKKRTDQPSS